MELLKAELSLILGESISRIETLHCQSQSCLYAIYDRSGHAMPMAVRCFSQPGLAEQQARKLMLLRQKGTIPVPVVYGVVVSERLPFHELLLMGRIGGISAEAPASSAEQWQTLAQQITEGLGAWHSHSADGMSGYVDSTQKIRWPDWYLQHTSVLLALLRQKRQTVIPADDQQLLHRSLLCHETLFADLNAPNVLVHGNLTLNTIIKDPRTGHLLAMVQPGRVLWAPAEYELFRLQNSPREQSLLQCYLKKYGVDEGFIWRCSLYRLWDQVEQLIHNRPFSTEIYSEARGNLLPWLE